MAGGEELNRIHNRIDAMTNDVTVIKVSVARIEERLHIQPCEMLHEHLKSHDAKKDRAWQIALKFLNPAAIWAVLVWIVTKAK